MKILSRSDRPDAVFLKECAAYFPGNLTQYQALIRNWTDQCLKAGVIPILVTVAPVREPSIFRVQYWKNIVKKIIYPSRPTVEARLSDLMAYNDWLRKYAASRSLRFWTSKKVLGSVKRIAVCEPILMEVTGYT